MRAIGPGTGQRALSLSPTFTVVIPTFNHAEYLRVALQSVFDQTCQDFEVIVVNNYSSDHTLDVIREIGDSRIRVINFRNEGVIGASRNEGIKESLGRYVAFLDSDDRWRENKLERVAQVFEEGPGLGLVCHDLALVREGQEVARTRFGPPPSYRGTLYDHLLFSFNGPATSASVVVKHKLEEAGMFSQDPNLVTVEDYGLWLELAKICEFRFIPEVLGEATLHSDNASGNVELHLRNGLALIDKQCAALRESERTYSRRAIRRLYARSYFVAARRYHRRNVFKQTFGYYLQTIRVYPLFGRAYLGLGLLMAGSLLRPVRRNGSRGAVIGPSSRWGSQL